MDDREIVAAIVAADLAGLAAAYDEHAQSLYGYCRWMLSEPEDAANAVEETFVIAAARLGDLRDPRKLRPWLYAVARDGHRPAGRIGGGPRRARRPARSAVRRPRRRRAGRAAQAGPRCP